MSRRLFQSTLVTGGMTLLSRISGLVRDMVFAGFIGAGAGIAADAFYAAFRIPNFLRRIFGEGAFSQSFVPVFAEYKAKYNVDGMMIGRASIGYPWIFNEIKHFLATGEKLPIPDLNERIAVAKKHLDFSVEWKGEKQGILEMRRHYTNYFRGMPNFKTFRTEMVTAETYAQVAEILEQVAEAYADYEFQS